MKNYFDKKYVLASVKFLITFLLFVQVKDLSTIDNFSKLVVTLLEFIIVLELVRMLIDFMFSEEHKIMIRFMIDSTIVFFIRDLMLIVNDSFNSKKIFTILCVIGILLIFRIISTKFSPSNLGSK